MRADIKWKMNFSPNQILFYLLGKMDKKHKGKGKSKSKIKK